MRMTDKYVVRNATPADFISAELLQGMSILKLDADWTWVVETQGAVKAVVLACPCHGVIFIMRLAATPDAPRGWLRPTLKTVLRDCRERGYFAAMTYATVGREEEVKLLRIAARAGWVLAGVEQGVWAAGTIEELPWQS